jgi:predicted ABC-type ATPase
MRQPCGHRDLRFANPPTRRRQGRVEYTQQALCQGESQVRRPLQHRTRSGTQPLAGEMPKHRRKPLCIVIAGPNGSGKTTFARRYLPENVGVFHFVNADLIAGGLSPLKPERAAIAAARIVVREIDRLAAERADFAFETTLSGLAHVSRLRAWKHVGYRIEIVYLRLRSVRLAERRVAARVKQGGHDVPRRDLIRRFSRSWDNFDRVYRPLADSWVVYDNSGRTPRLLERSS